MKFIARVMNLEKWGRDARLSGYQTSLMAKYNAKPVLTRPQHVFFRGPDYLEVSMNCHQWNYLGRKSLSGMRGRMHTMDCAHAFLVQGNTGEARNLTCALHAHRRALGWARAGVALRCAWCKRPCSPHARCWMPVRRPCPPRRRSTAGGDPGVCAGDGVGHGEQAAARPGRPGGGGADDAGGRGGQVQGAERRVDG